MAVILAATAAFEISMYALLNHSVSNAEIERVKAAYPQYVAQYESMYGRFMYAPELVFEYLEDSCGRVRDDKIIIGTFRMDCGRDTPSTLKHELAHIAVVNITTHSFREWVRAEKGNMWVKGGDEAFEIIERLNEGSAEYLTLENGGKLNPGYAEYYEFVKPVLDRMGVKDGVRLLFDNPPAFRELSDPDAYYARIFGTR